MDFFGPHSNHSMHPMDSSFNSLPRRSSQNNLIYGHSHHTGTFQRNTPVRRSAGVADNHLEYYVPRSMSEFNLSGVGDLALPPSKRGSLQQPQMQPITTKHPAFVSQTLMPKAREKMVTFEDETRECPHGVPTTPRKGPMSDVFM